MKAWRALPRFRPGAPFRPWLLAIVANEARNRRRAAGRRAGLALRAAEQAERVRGQRRRLAGDARAGRRAPRDAAGGPRRPSTSATARSSPAATCSSSPRRRRRRRWAAGGARSSRGPRARSSACARTRASRRWGRRDRARARLLALRDEVAWPPTPDLATAVQARVAREPRDARGAPRLAARPARARARRRARPPARVGRACSPPRRASARRCATGSASARCASRASSACPTSRRPVSSTSAAARPRPRPAPTSAAPSPRSARSAAPDAIYVDDAPPPRVSLVYAARPGLPPATAGVGALLDQLQGDSTAFIEKFVAGGVPITPVRVNGARGYFIAGPHASTSPTSCAPASPATPSCGCTTR